MPAADNHETEDERLLHRMLFFSDAVFAIVLTLLALELKPPHASDPAHAVAEMANHLIAFALSFGLVALIWTSHMNILRRLSRFDWPTSVMNLVLLAPVCLLPFASSLVSQAWFSFLGWYFYSAVLIATSLGMIGLILVSTRNAGILVGGMTRRERIYRVIRAASPGVAFAGCLVALHFGMVRAPQFMWMLIPVQFGFARWLMRPQARLSDALGTTKVDAESSVPN